MARDAGGADHGAGAAAGVHGKVRGAGEADHGEAQDTGGTVHGAGRAGRVHGKTQELFYMYSGGFRQVNNLAPGQTIRRAAVGVPPAIDLAALPEE